MTRRMSELDSNINKWEVPMSDDKRNRGAADRARININESYELRDWSKRFNVHPDDLKKAVAAVGTSADAVEKYFASAKS